MARCLVVDDSESMREILGDHLTALGHEVFEAGGAEASIDVLRTGEPDVSIMFLDWDLPALGALEVLRAAATAPKRPAIILCATEHDTRQLSLAAAAGAPHHLLKPFDRAGISRVLERIEAPVAA